MLPGVFRQVLGADSEVRVLQRQHAAELFAMVEECREHLREWLPWVDDTRSAADSERFIADSVAQLASNQSFQAGIFQRGLLVGVIGYHPIDWRNRKTALGYWLAPEAMGQGLMTQASRALLDHGFRELGLARIEIRCATQNKRSRAIPERLGFRQEGIARRAEWLYDHFVDLVIYAMLASDWTATSR
jgi:ribosomal-protein-serine acetyltransferase